MAGTHVSAGCGVDAAGLPVWDTSTCSSITAVTFNTRSVSVLQYEIARFLCLFCETSSRDKVRDVQVATLPSCSSCRNSSDSRAGK